LKIAIVQLNSGNDTEKNLERAERFVNEAAEKKPDMILLPEYSNYVGPLGQAHIHAETSTGKWFTALSGLSKSKRIHLLAGILESTESGKSSSVVYSFDPEGKNPGISQVADIMSGFAICYDLRFPELFRYMAFHGVKIVYVPSAFTNATGVYHWEILLRARAIENQVFIVAANQVGESEGAAACYGHSMIVDPWGRILAEAPGIGDPAAECVITCDIDFDAQAEIRKNLPCLHHMKIEKII
jgi:predicted amidohydrolase